MLHELAQLQAIRLKRDLSYKQLADHMRSRAGVVISGRTLHAILNTKPGTRLQDRTLFKIRQYLKTLGVAERANDRRRDRRRARAIDAIIAREVQP